MYEAKLSGLKGEKIVLVYSDNYNEMPQNAWLKPQKSISHNNGGWEVQD